METYFFDTNGNLWMTCSMDVDGAEAFGPSGAAVHIDVAHKADETPWSEATRLGLVIRGEWDTLVDGGLNAGNGEDPCCTFNAAAAMSEDDASAGWDCAKGGHRFFSAEDEHCHECGDWTGAVEVTVIEPVITRAAHLVVGGVYGSAGDCRVEVRQNRATHEVPDYEASELHITIISGDAEAADEDCRESAVCRASVWRAAVAGVLSESV